MSLPRDRVSTTGLLLFAAAMAFLGIELVLTGHLPAALVPLSPGAMSPWATRSLGFLLAGTVLVAGFRPDSPARYLLAAFPLVAVLTVNGPQLVESPRNPSPWTTVFELIALSAGGVMLVKPNIGRRMLAISLAVFGTQHLMYADFVATLVPTWIPAHLFWAYAVGFAFFAASLSALLNKTTRLSATLLGLMFFSWVVVLHIPRVFANPGSEPEITSTLVALGLSGVSLMVAGASTQRRYADQIHVATARSAREYREEAG